MDNLIYQKYNKGKWEVIKPSKWYKWNINDYIEVFLTATLMSGVLCLLGIGI